MKNRATTVLGTVAGLVGLAVYTGRVLKRRAAEETDAILLRLTDEEARRLLHAIVYGVPGEVEPWENPPQEVLDALDDLETRHSHQVMRRALGYGQTPGLEEATSPGPQVPWLDSWAADGPLVTDQTYGPLHAWGPIHVGEPRSGKSDGLAGLLSPWAVEKMDRLVTAHLEDHKTGLPMEDGEHVEPIVERWTDSRPSGIGNFMASFTEPTQADDVAVDDLYRVYQEDGGQVTLEGFQRILKRLGYTLRLAGGRLFVDGVALQPPVETPREANLAALGEQMQSPQVDWEYVPPDTLREQRDPDA